MQLSFELPKRGTKPLHTRVKRQAPWRSHLVVARVQKGNMSLETGMPCGERSG
jgi:hypothetical protein